MKDLIEALTIFAKYTDASHPTNCEHDKLCVLVDPTKVSENDQERLADLSFFANARDQNFYSLRFGSA